MYKARVSVWAGIAAICLNGSAQASEPLKSGTYSGHFGWTFTGQVQELGAQPKVYAGMGSGVVFNDTGSGFLHKARTDCAILNDVEDGRANAKGTCVVTDAEGDKVFVEWKCAGPMPACPGTERSVGGTGIHRD